MTIMVFSVRATQVQAVRWGALASRMGFDSVGSWLTHLADREIEQRGPYMLRMPLQWRRERFYVMLIDHEGGAGEYEATGPCVGSFAIFRGNRWKATARGRCTFSLIHRPSGQVLITLRYERECQALAAELYRLPVQWESIESPIDNPDVRKVLDRVRASRPQ